MATARAEGWTVRRTLQLVAVAALLAVRVAGATAPEPRTAVLLLGDSNFRHLLDDAAAARGSGCTHASPAALPRLGRGNRSEVRVRPGGKARRALACHDGRREYEFVHHYGVSSAPPYCSEVKCNVEKPNNPYSWGTPPPSSVELMAGATATFAASRRNDTAAGDLCKVAVVLSGAWDASRWFHVVGDEMRVAGAAGETMTAVFMHAHEQNLTAALAAVVEAAEEAEARGAKEQPALDGVLIWLPHELYANAMGGLNHLARMSAAHVAHTLAVAGGLRTAGGRRVPVGVLDPHETIG